MSSFVLTCPLLPLLYSQQKISQHRNCCFEASLIKSDQKLVSVLALLDLSAAFDTLDHAILLRRTESTFGISEVALSWFESYLSDGTQSVMVEGLKSTPIPLVFGVPQGSVLGPVLFSLYSQPLPDVISYHSCDYHKYADDTEISDSAPPSDFTSAQSNIQSCISDTLPWMRSNKLKLNTEKAEMMLVGSSMRISSVDCESADIGGSSIPFQTTVTYLGVHLDQTLSMKQHTSSLFLTTFIALRRIASIRPFLSNSFTEKLVASMITSRLDYCNATFAGVADEQ